MQWRPLAAVLALASLGSCAEKPQPARTSPPAPRTPGPTPLDADALRRQLRQHGLARVADSLADLAEPCLRLRHRDGPVSGPTTRLGGAPDLPATVDWPRWQGKPLAFVCQLRLEELPAGAPGLPAAGLLSFFYVSDQSTWGFDPADAGSFRVIFTPDAAACEERSLPQGIADSARFRPVLLSPQQVWSLPSPRNAKVEALKLTDAEDSAFGEFDLDLMHQVGGHPRPVQGDDMQTECTMIAAGISLGDGKAWADPRLAGWQSKAGEWRLLLQLDSDGHMMWGDLGCLYFWIHRDDLAERRFDRAWMILQCS